VYLVLVQENLLRPGMRRAIGEEAHRLIAVQGGVIVESHSEDFL